MHVWGTKAAPGWNRFPIWDCQHASQQTSIYMSQALLVILLANMLSETSNWDHQYVIATLYVTAPATNGVGTTSEKR